jgi:O-antigen/teichoic acid export membrane protein
MKHIIVSLLVNGLIQALNLVGGVLSARYLLPEGRGLLAAAMLWPGLFAVFGSLTFDQGVLYYTATRRDSAASLLTTGMVLAAVLAIVTTVAGYVAVPYIFSAATPELISDTQLYLLFIPGNFFSLAILNCLSGRLDFGQLNIQRLVAPLGYVTIIIGCVFVGSVSVRSFIWASLITQLTVVLTGFLACRKIGLGRFRLEDAGVVLKYGLTLHLNTLIVIVGQRIDQTIISLYLPADRLGLYVVALSVATLAALPGGTLQMLAFPKIASQRTLEGRATLLHRYLLLATILTSGAAVVVFSVIPWLLIALYGPSFYPAIKLVGILLLGAIPAALSVILQGAYQAYGSTAVVVQLSLVRLTITAIVLALLVARYDLVGATWAFTIAQWATVLFALLHLRTITKIRTREFLRITPSDVALATEFLSRCYRFLRQRGRKPI